MRVMCGHYAKTIRRLATEFYLPGTVFAREDAPFALWGILRPEVQACPTWDIHYLVPMLPAYYKRNCHILFVGSEDPDYVVGMSVVVFFKGELSLKLHLVNPDIVAAPDVHRRLYQSKYLPLEAPCASLDINGQLIWLKSTPILPPMDKL